MVGGNVTAKNITSMQTKLEHCSAMSEYTDDNKSLLGITNSTILNQLIDDGLVPKNSVCRLWINDNSIYGQEIRTTLNSLFHKSIFGYLIITRSQDERHLRIKAYDTLDTYETTYTETNNRGWYGTWLQTGGKSTTWYLNWKGVWVGIIEYQEFFFVYFRGTLTSDITPSTYHIISSDITFNTNSVSPILFTNGQYGECTINSSGISINIATSIKTNSWICGQAFVYKMPA